MARDILEKLVAGQEKTNKALEDLAKPLQSLQGTMDTLAKSVEKLSALQSNYGKSLEDNTSELQKYLKGLNQIVKIQKALAGVTTDATGAINEQGEATEESSDDLDDQDKILAEHLAILIKVKKSTEETTDDIKEQTKENKKISDIIKKITENKKKQDKEERKKKGKEELKDSKKSYEELINSSKIFDKVHAHVFKRASKNVEEFNEIVGENATGMVAAGGAAIYAADKIGTFLKEIQATAVGFAQFNIQIKTLAESDIIAPGGVKQLEAVRAQLHMTRAEFKEFGHILEEGAMAGVGSIDSIAEAASKLREMYGGDQAEKLKTYIELLKEFPTLDQDININANFDDQAAAWFALAQKGKVTQAVELQNAGVLGGTEPEEKGGPDVDLVNSAQNTEAYLENIQAFLYNKFLPSWTPFVAGSIEQAAKGVEGILTMAGGIYGTHKILNKIFGKPVPESAHNLAVQTVVGKDIDKNVMISNTKLDKIANNIAKSGGGGNYAAQAARAATKGGVKGGKATSFATNVLKNLGGDIAGDIVSNVTGMGGDIVGDVANTALDSLAIEAEDAALSAGNLAKVGTTAVESTEAAAASAAELAIEAKIAGANVGGLAGEAAQSGKLLGIFPSTIAGVSTAALALGVGLTLAGAGLAYWGYTLEKEAQKRQEEIKAEFDNFKTSGSMLKDWQKQKSMLDEHKSQVYKEAGVHVLKMAGAGMAVGAATGTVVGAVGGAGIGAAPGAALGAGIGAGSGAMTGIIDSAPKVIAAFLEIDDEGQRMKKEWAAVTKNLQEAEKWEKHLNKLKSKEREEMNKSHLDYGAHTAAINNISNSSTTMLQNFTEELGKIKLDIFNKMGGTAEQFNSAMADTTKAVSDRFAKMNEVLAARRMMILKDTKLEGSERKMALDQLHKVELEAAKKFADSMLELVGSWAKSPVVEEAQKRITGGKQRLDLGAGTAGLESGALFEQLESQAAESVKIFNASAAGVGQDLKKIQDVMKKNETQKAKAEQDNGAALAEYLKNDSSMTNEEKESFKKTYSITEENGKKVFKSNKEESRKLSDKLQTKIEDLEKQATASGDIGYFEEAVTEAAKKAGELAKEMEARKGKAKTDTEKEDITKELQPQIDAATEQQQTAQKSIYAAVMNNPDNMAAMLGNLSEDEQKKLKDAIGKVNAGADIASPALKEGISIFEKQYQLMKVRGQIAKSEIRKERSLLVERQAFLKGSLQETDNTNQILDMINKSAAEQYQAIKNYSDTLSAIPEAIGKSAESLHAQRKVAKTEFQVTAGVASGKGAAAIGDYLDATVDMANKLQTDADKAGKALANTLTNMPDWEASMKNFTDGLNTFKDNIKNTKIDDPKIKEAFQKITDNLETGLTTNMATIGKLGKKRAKHEALIQSGKTEEAKQFELTPEEDTMFSDATAAVAKDVKKAMADSNSIPDAGDDLKKKMKSTIDALAAAANGSATTLAAMPDTIRKAADDYATKSAEVQVKIVEAMKKMREQLSHVDETFEIQGFKAQEDAADAAIEYAGAIWDSTKAMKASGDALKAVTGRSQALTKAIEEFGDKELQAQDKMIMGLKKQLETAPDDKKQEILDKIHTAEQNKQIIMADVQAKKTKTNTELAKTMADKIQAGIDAGVKGFEEQADMAKFMADSTSELGGNINKINQFRQMEISMEAQKVAVIQNGLSQTRDQMQTIAALMADGTKSESERAALQAQYDALAVTAKKNEFGLAKEQVNLQKTALGAQRDSMDKLLSKVFGGMRESRGAQRGIGSDAMMLGAMGRVYNKAGQVTSGKAQTLQQRQAALVGGVGGAGGIADINATVGAGAQALGMGGTALTVATRNPLENLQNVKINKETLKNRKMENKLTKEKIAEDKKDLSLKKATPTTEKDTTKLAQQQLDATNKVADILGDIKDNTDSDKTKVIAAKLAARVEPPAVGAEPKEVEKFAADVKAANEKVANEIKASAGKTEKTAPAASDKKEVMGVAEQKGDRLQAKLAEVKEELSRRRHQPIPEVGNWLKSVKKNKTQGAMMDAAASFKDNIKNTKTSTQTEMAKLQQYRMASLAPAANAAVAPAPATNIATAPTVPQAAGGGVTQPKFDVHATVEVLFDTEMFRQKVAMIAVKEASTNPTVINSLAQKFVRAP